MVLSGSIWQRKIKDKATAGLLGRSLKPPIALLFPRELGLLAATSTSQGDCQGVPGRGDKQRPEARLCPAKGDKLQQWQTPVMVLDPEGLLGCKQSLPPDPKQISRGRGVT